MALLFSLICHLKYGYTAFQEKGALTQFKYKNEHEGCSQSRTVKPPGAATRKDAALDWIGDIAFLPPQKEKNHHFKRCLLAKLAEVRK